MFESLFCRKKWNVKKALQFGFVKTETGFRYETDLMMGMFLLEVFITATDVATQLTEKETGEEYILYKTNAAGPFVGEVRAAVESVLQQVADACYDDEVFKSPQTKEIIRFVQRKYGDEPEFLWEKFPDCAAFRRKDTAKWYATVLTVAKNKLGLDSMEKVEIIDLRIEPEKIADLLKKEYYYPGWHMNKKSWYTIILDGSVATEEICRLIEESYALAVK